MVSLEEKSGEPKSGYAVLDLCVYDNRMEETKNIKPSARGKIEFTAVNQAYLDMGELHVILFGWGMTWLGLGTSAGLLKAQILCKPSWSGSFYVTCIKGIAGRRGFLDAEQLRRLGEELKMTEYGQYLLSLAGERFL